jgi:hypothetical protein
MDISKGIAARGLRSSNPHVFRRVIAGNVKYQNFLLKKAKILGFGKAQPGSAKSL